MQSITKNCKINNCLGNGDPKANGRYYFIKGYCKGHYLRLRRYGDPLKTKEKVTKICARDDCVRVVRKNSICTIHRSRVKKTRREIKVYHPLYNTWAAMKRRCYNPNYKSYKYWGGRGIKVCDEWLGKEGFWRFVAHIGNKPSHKHSIDRINNNGNYEPGNVRWATYSQQINNRG